MNDGTRATVAAASPSPHRGRRETVDFWRGFILCTIFVSHNPGNLFENFTFRNFGFSDSAEAFVFISGLSLALAYGPRFDTDRGMATARLVRRVAKLYGVHIALSLAGLAIFAIGAAVAGDPDLMQSHGRDLFVDDPGAALVGLISLGHQLGYFNILPLYVLLVAVAPVLFWLGRISRPLMLGVSLAIYVLSRLTGLNVPSWPIRGEWFLNPFAWQFMMTIGLAVGLSLRDHAFRPRRSLLVVSAVVVVACAFCATDGLSFLPGLEDQARAWADLDKTNLGLGRLVHFIALAYLVVSLRLAPALQKTACFGPLSLIGRNGLGMFCQLSLMAALGQVLATALGHSVALDCAVTLGGLAILYGSAVLLQTWREAKPLALAFPSGR